jgi:hypothetical protein
VVILDSANNGNIHQQIKSRGRAEVRSSPMPSFIDALFVQLICASNNSTPFRFDEFGGLVTVMKNQGNANELSVSSVNNVIADPSTGINPNNDFLMPH